jgi:hypothetical protein
MFDSVRDLFDAGTLAATDAAIAVEGYYTIDQVRQYLESNVKGEYTYVDTDDLVWLDLHINYDIFLVKDYAYSREELEETYPFEAFATTPEQVFVRQALVRTDAPDAEPDLEHQDIDVGAGDAGIDAETVKDKIRRQRNRAHLSDECTKRVARMQVLVGKDDWKNFKLMKRFVRGAQKFLALEGFSFTQAARALPLLLMAPADKDAPKGAVELLDEKNYYVPELEL